jgi:AraC family transcriptional regulator
LRAIDEYLEQSCGHCPTASELARLCGVSTRNLQRKIRQSTGMSISAYVAEAQLARAKALLKQRRLPLKEIAFQLGFSSHSNFSAAFRKAVGQSPSEYRNDHA